MADIANVPSEKSNKNQSNFEVITLSSDDEQSEQSNVDVNFLFKRFILACRPHVTKDAIKDARSLFTEVQEKLSESHNVVNMLKRYHKEISKSNADLYLSMICSSLTEETSGKDKSVEVKSVGEKVAKSVTFCDVIAARGFEPKAKLATNQNNNPSTSTVEVATISDDDDDDFVSKESSKKKPNKIKNMPSTSNATAENSKGKISTSKLTAKEKKKLVARLKQRLKEISNEIKILNRAELTLEEMDMSDSTYIKENRLKKRFEKTWNKLCKLLGRPPNTGRVVEKAIRASSTGYSMIDKAVAKFLKEKHNSFPDYFDIRDIVQKANQKHDLRMSSQVLNGIIADIFTDIGNKLQRRRERDLLFNFGSHLLDDFKAEDDPALSDANLANQLQKNRRISKRNLKHVYAKYTHLERYNYDDKTRMSGSSRVNKDTNSSSDDEQNTEGSRNHKKYARLDRHEVMGKSIMKGSRRYDSDISSESSDNEQDLSGIQDDNSVVVDDSDTASSQEIPFANSPCKPDTSLSHSEQSLLDTDQVTVSTDNNISGSPTFPLALAVPICQESEMLEPTVSTLCSNGNSDCEIINKPKEKLLTLVNIPLIPEYQANTNHEIVNDPAGLPLTTKQLDEPISKLQVSEDHSNTENDCGIVNDPAGLLVTTKQLDEPISKPQVSGDNFNTDNDCQIVNEPAGLLVTTKQLDEPISKPPVSGDHSNTNNDCEIINNLKQHSVSMEQLDEPAKELANEPTTNTDDDCLIIDEDPPAQSNPLKIPTSAPSQELTRTINVLLDVFRKRAKSVDQSTVSSCDNTVSGAVPESVPENVCETESLDFKPTKSNSSVSHTSTSKTCESTIDNIEEDSACGHLDLKTKCMSLYPDNDVMMSANDQCSDSLRRSVEISDCPQSPKINHTIPSTSTTSPPRPRDTDSIETPGNVNNSSPSPSKSTTDDTSGLVNPRKRKATTELSVQIKKSSVECLEQIAWALKNKRLKLPDSWVNNSKVRENSGVSPPKATTSKESSTGSNTSFKPSTKESSTSNAPFKPATPNESSTVSNASFKPPTTKESSTVRSSTSTVSSAALEPVSPSKGSSGVGQTSRENNPHLLKNKGVIFLQQRQVFREKTLNALKVPTKPVCNLQTGICNNVNGAFPTVDSTPSSESTTNVSLPASDSVDNADINEVIIIDD